MYLTYKVEHIFFIGNFLKIFIEQINKLSYLYALAMRQMPVRSAKFIFPNFMFSKIIKNLIIKNQEPIL